MTHELRTALLAVAIFAVVCLFCCFAPLKQDYDDDDWQLRQA
jgi:hypothetical protein